MSGPEGDAPETKRRHFLKAAGGVGTLAVSACFGARESGDPGGDSTGEAPADAPRTTFERRADDNVLHQVDSRLDLGGLVSEKRSSLSAPVDLGPALVAGEGAHEDNHTVVRVFDRYQTMTAQFLAYPPAVTGGVEVVAGAFLGPDEGPLVAAAPLAADEVDRVRLFTPAGALRATLEPTGVSPPYLLAAGDLVSDRAGDELAVAGRRSEADEPTVLVYDGSGGLRAAVDAPAGDASTGPRALTVDPGEDGAQLRYQRGQTVAAIDVGAESASQTHDLDGAAWNWTAHPSAFDDAESWLTGPANRLSTVRRVADGAAGEVVDVGRKENRFWYWSPHTVDEVAEPGADEYVGFAPFEHIRVDANSPQYHDPDYDSDDYADWVDDDLVDQYRETYRQQPAIWEPTATHRGFGNQTDAWRTPTYPDGTPKYLQLDAEGLPHGVVEPLEGMPTEGGDGEDEDSFRVPGDSAFDYLSYAPKLDAVQRVFHWPLRRFLRGLAPAFRGPDGVPEHLKALVPAHEHEIHPPGDYNPAMVTGFREYLERLYGDVEAINERFGTSFADAAAFDAPRDHDRGPWDAFATENEFWLQWLFYNRYVVNRHVLTAFSEALLAGFPPEAIKSHQIPDFGEVGDVERITPIDTILSAGASFGATNYGLFHEAPGNWLAGAHSSGHRNIQIGEYHARTADTEQARQQLQYIFDHGGMHTHVCCTGTEATYAADQAAAESIRDAERPRPGVTGGTGQVRPVSYESGDRAERYNVVQLGNAETRQGLVDVDLSGDEGPARSGLLKSVDADGAWTGTVYLTPFHAGVDVTPVAERDALTVTADGTAVALSDAVEDETGWIFQHNDQIEITFEAAVDDGTADLEVAAYADGARTPFDAVTFDVGESTRRFRYVVHNQLPLSDVEIRLRAGANDAEPSVTDLSVVAQRRETARKYFGDPLGTPHRGGVRFDVLRDPVPADGGGAR